MRSLRELSCRGRGHLLGRTPQRAPAYPGGGFESLLWVREARCTYGELNPAQLSRLGSRGKAARALAPQLRELLNLILSSAISAVVHFD